MIHATACDIPSTFWTRCIILAPLIFRTFTSGHQVPHQFGSFRILVICLDRQRPAEAILQLGSLQHIGCVLCWPPFCCLSFPPLPPGPSLPVLKSLVNSVLFTSSSYGTRSISYASAMIPRSSPTASDHPPRLLTLPLPPPPPPPPAGHPCLDRRRKGRVRAGRERVQCYICINFLFFFPLSLLPFDTVPSHLSEHFVYYFPPPLREAITLFYYSRASLERTR